MDTTINTTGMRNDEIPKCSLTDLVEFGSMEDYASFVNEAIDGDMEDAVALRASELIKYHIDHESSGNVTVLRAAELLRDYDKCKYGSMVEAYHAKFHDEIIIKMKFSFPNDFGSEKDVQAAIDDCGTAEAMIEKMAETAKESGLAFVYETDFGAVWEGTHDQCEHAVQHMPDWVYTSSIEESDD